VYYELFKNTPNTCHYVGSFTIYKSHGLWEIAMPDGSILQSVEPAFVLARAIRELMDQSWYTTGFRVRNNQRDLTFTANVEHSVDGAHIKYRITHHRSRTAYAETAYELDTVALIQACEWIV
jgi:hypothetical protein